MPSHRAHEQMHVSGCEVHEVARTVCVGFCLFCLLQANCCLSSESLKFPVCPPGLLAGGGVSQGKGAFPLSQLPPRDTDPNLIPFFFFVLPSYAVNFLASLVV